MRRQLTAAFDANLPYVVAEVMSDAGRSELDTVMVDVVIIEYTLILDESLARRLVTKGERVTARP